MSHKVQYIDMKDGVNNLDMMFLNPNVLMILAYVNLFCFENNIDFQITSMIRTPEDDLRLGAKSTTHSTGRAFDFSIRKEHGWDDFKVQKLVGELETLYSHIGAISRVDGIAKPIVVHDSGTGMHAHIQVRPSKRGIVKEGFLKKLVASIKYKDRRVGWE